MKITALIENTSAKGLETRHGLALYIETVDHKMLFDLGPDAEALFGNAEKLGIDLAAVDTVVISHGHRDHGGALEVFLQKNTLAKIYIQKQAFAPHYRVLPGEEPVYNGLDPNLQDHPRIILAEGDLEIDDELMLFTVPEEAQECRSEANAVLYERDHPDRFLHEQNLLIRGEKTALIMGCGHTGIVNILGRALAYDPVLCVGGYHLMNPTTGKVVSPSLLSRIAETLESYPQIGFYTCHCTGNAAFTYLSQKMKNMHYLACGDIIEL